MTGWTNTARKTKTTTGCAGRISLEIVCCLLAVVLAVTGCQQTPSIDELVVESNRGVALMGRFDYDGARTVFAALEENHPDNSDLLVNLAIATLNRQAEGDEALAIETLDRALELDSSNLRARYCRGLMALHAGEAEAALADFEVVVAADAQDSDAVYFVGQCLMQLERADEALEYYQKAIELDPYLRSAYYRAFQTLQRMGQRDEAMATLQTFRKLEHNPRGRLVEFKYTKMGRRGAAIPLGGTDVPSAIRPSGSIFDEPVALDRGRISWRAGSRTGKPEPSLSVCDINSDGLLDLFFAAAVEAEEFVSNAVALGLVEGGFALDIEHPLAEVTGVNAALWGDLDNDGLTDVYLCRQGPNQLWRAMGDGRFEEMTSMSETAGGDWDTADGALVDADHDGDLDIFLVNSDGPNELLNNDRDGGFRPLAAEWGLGGENQASKSVIFADLDGDRDADIVVLASDGPHEVLTNDLLWSYRQADGWESFRSADVAAAVAGDVDTDGRIELYTLGSDGRLSCWKPGDDGIWKPREIAALGNAGGPGQLALADVDGDGVLELVAQSGTQLSVVNVESGEIVLLPGEGTATWALASLDPALGPSLVTWAFSDGPALHNPGKGRFSFAAIEVSGQEDEGAALRSNASGIGTHLAVRIGPKWTVTSTFRHHSGPGQSLQPLSLGLGGAAAIDFIAIEWSDGVYQTEMNLAVGQLHRLTETQRQLSSCPVLFAWDGEQYAFVSDLLGVGGIGFAVGPGEYGEPRPWENFLMPDGLLKPKDGRLVLKIGEPMEEATYLDAVRLIAYDLPQGWSMAPDDRMGILGPAPTGKPLFYRRGLQPVEAVNQRGDTVTEAVLTADLRGAPVGGLDHRFIGLLKHEHVLTLRFDQRLDDFGDDLALVVDGWIEYPYSQTGFAAWQAGVAFEAPTLEARGSDGVWRTMLEQWGYPAGMPRRMAVPLPPLPAGTTELRLRTNQEIYWDRIEIVSIESCPEAVRTELPLVEAHLAQSGFALRSTGSQHLPHYDYSRRAPVWDTRSQEGWYTRLGPVEPLLYAADGATAIFGPGEEVHLEFSAPAGPPPEGHRRFYVLESEGWCKDMDLFTRDGQTLEPLPGSDLGGSERIALIEAYNTRYRQGRD